MKKTIYLIISICATLLAVQCAKIQETAQPAGQDVQASGSYMELRGDEVYMSICVSDKSDSKTTIGTDRSVSWKKGDKLYVVAPTGGCIGCLVAENDGASATFVGSVSGWTGEQTLQFYYLGAGTLKGGDTTYSYDISSQDGKLSTLASSLHLMHGAIAGLQPTTKELGNLTMTSLIAVARFDLTGASGLDAVQAIKNTTYASATLNLADASFTNKTKGDITLSNPSTDYYVAYIPGSKSMSFWQTGKGMMFSAGSELEANQFCTNSGNPIPVTNPGGYIEDDFSYGPGTEINGIIWAPVNCGISFNGKYEYGKLYQFGRKIGSGYNDGSTYVEDSYQTVVTGQALIPENDKFYAGSADWCSSATKTTKWPISSSDYGYDEATVSNPCPTGWRIATKSEMDALIANYSSWTSESFLGNDQNGYYFSGSNTYSADCDKTFFPAAGERSTSDGTSGYRGDWGCYWTNLGVENNGNAWNIYFDDGTTKTPQAAKGNRSNGYSVRCVKENVQELEWIDLDLPSGVLWANMNLGARAEEDYGNFYAWGELETKEDYSWSTYKYGTSESNMTKYNTIDRISVLDPSDDVAYVTLGDGARIPTNSQWQELKSNCTYTWETLNEIEGYRFTSKVNPSKSIFLPIGGNMKGKVKSDTSEGQYWACDLYTGSEVYYNYWQYAYRFSFSSSTWGSYDLRAYGRVVRAVKEND